MVVLPCGGTVDRPIVFDKLAETAKSRAAAAIDLAGCLDRRSPLDVRLGRFSSP
jgi:hypothetical protein